MDHWKSVAKLLFVSIIFCALNTHYVTTFTERSRLRPVLYTEYGGKAIIYVLGFLKGLVPGLGAFLCGERMFFLCLCRFSLSITASSQSPKTCMWGKLEIGKSKLSDVGAGVWLWMVVCLSMWWTMNWQSVTLPSSNSSWERLQQTLATPSAGKKGIEDEWLHGWITLSSVTKLRAPNYNLFFSFLLFL